jgi:hypothetical protein
MNCLFERNPAGGFESMHKFHCAFCDDDATHHLNVSYWCGNVCKAHADRQAAKHKQAEIEEGIIQEAANV